mmetsp:Transcript_13133/g.28506  ORF Transcript_13133/g.28506 Transcript_13133/m.28506 type:complete len:99 (+) Transcript_13133:404-700(+)
MRPSVKGWSEEDRAAAAREFEIPRCTEFLVVYSELLDLGSLGIWKRGLNGICSQTLSSLWIESTAAVDFSYRGPKWSKGKVEGVPLHRSATDYDMTVW